MVHDFPCGIFCIIKEKGCKGFDLFEFAQLDEGACKVVIDEVTCL